MTEEMKISYSMGGTYIPTTPRDSFDRDASEGDLASSFCVGRFTSGIGTPSCRFQGGPGLSITSAGEVPRGKLEEFYWV